MAKTTVIWFLFLFILTSSQRLHIGRSDSGICKDVACNTIDMLLAKLKNCVVVVGNLKLCIMEKTTTGDFADISFPELREVTGFVLVYRINGLESLGKLFPNLARIRGTQLLDNFGLVVHDMPNLRELGLYSLLKIDRGGASVWGGPHTCFVETVDWKAIAPKYGHVLTKADIDAHCKPCICTSDPRTNYCWNRKKCQRFLERPHARSCHDQCLGCREGYPDECIMCRHYTYRGHCVQKCPGDTIILPENKYCITEEECTGLNRWEFNKTCVFKCPLDYKRVKKGINISCELCLNCTKYTCEDQKIHSISTIQSAERCSYINGSLVIHVRAVAVAMEELRKYLGRIEEVSDYVIINSSLTITSLDFLPSLRVIRGLNLFKNRYSLIIYEMKELKTLFTPTVTKNLTISRGTLTMYRNPKLCRSKIDEILPVFKEKPAENDIPPGMNGYSGECPGESVDVEVNVLNETTAVVTFNSLPDPETEYTVLYIRLPPGSQLTFVPESCSESKWHAISASSSGIVKLTSLRPASTYAVCVETYSFFDNRTHLARSNIVNFKTPFSRPAPPFITELVATTSQTATLRWVNHKDYRTLITHYELDVSLIEIYPKDLNIRDHCDNVGGFLEDTYSRHVIAYKPHPDYESSCDSMCGIQSTVDTIEEYLDLEACSIYDFDCGTYEKPPPKNTTIGPYVRTAMYNISGKRKKFQVGRLAPFRDYRFRLRACVNDKCSRSTTPIIRTLRSAQADIPKITYFSANKIGEIYVEWKSPEVTNGPLLAYFVQVVPYTNIEWESICVLPKNHTSYNLTVKLEIVTKYLLRVCSTTLGSINACSEWETILLTRYYLWIAISFGFLLTFVSTGIGFYWRRRQNIGDMVPLVHSSSSSYCNGSEPVTSLLADTEPMYTVPLHDALIGY